MVNSHRTIINNRFLYYCFFVYSNFSSFAFTFPDIDRNTSHNRFNMERKVLEHIKKTVSRMKKNQLESILELYGPLTYEEYDKVMEYINNKKDEDN